MSGCPHCPDGHAEPLSRPWGVYVSPQRDSDGQPTHLIVQPSAGHHVAESDAEWLWTLIRRAAVRTEPPDGFKSETRPKTGLVYCPTGGCDKVAGHSGPCAPFGTEPQQ